MRIRPSASMISLLAAAALAAGACGSRDADTVPPCGSAHPDPSCAITCLGTGAVGECPTGFHCGSQGVCDAQCTLGGDQCGMGNVCTSDGYCEPLTFGPDANNPLGIDADLGCPAIHFTVMPIVPTVQLLIDQSGSMTTSFGNTTRWEAVKTALTDPNTGVVTTLQSQVVFGATLFTGHNGGPTCPVLTTSSDRVINNGPEITALLASHEPDNDTPTGESINQVVADFAANPPMANSPAIIVLATDGEPDDCAIPNPSTTDQNNTTRAVAVAAAQAAFSAGIKLYILGVGGDAGADNLQQMANAGLGEDPITGTATPYSATDPSALAAAFQTIIGGTRTCDLTLSGPIYTSQANTGTVSLDGTNLTYNTGWTIVGAQGAESSSTIRLIGTACDTLLTEASPVVDAYFPCGAVPPQ